MITEELSAQIAQLKIALADAIRRPMGVVPKSAEGLITELDIMAAEARRAERKWMDEYEMRKGVENTQTGGW